MQWPKKTENIWEGWQSHFYGSEMPKKKPHTHYLQIKTTLHSSESSQESNFPDSLQSTAAAQPGSHTTAKENIVSVFPKHILATL